MRHLVIVGVGGFAREVYWNAMDSIGYGKEWDIKGFLDGDVRLPSEEYEKLELPLLGNVLSYGIQAEDVFVCAVASPEVKKKLIGIVRKRGGEFISLVHRTAILHGNIKIGTGVILSPYVIIHDHAIVGDYVTFNDWVGIGHDASVGEYSSVMGFTSINGGARVGACTFWGLNSIAMPKSVVEDDAFIGVGSVVFKHVRKGQRVFGNPARPI